MEEQTRVYDRLLSMLESRVIVFGAWWISSLFECFGSALDRAFVPDLFWFRVALTPPRCVIAALFLSLLFGLSTATSAWLFCSYVAVYVTIIFMTIMRCRPDLAMPLE